MAMKLDFDNPNRDYLIDSYLSALSDKMGDTNEKEQEVSEMPELIERHALLKKVYEHPQERERMTDGEWCRKCIYEAPKVEAEPVRHGRWIECDYKNMEHGMIETEPKAGLCCSECRTAFQKKKMTYKQYCAACGARMDATDTNVDGKGGDDNGFD